MIRANHAVQSPTASRASRCKLTLALLRRAWVPFRIREMRSAEPQAAPFTEALALPITRFVQARNALAHLLFRLNAGRIHRILRITKELSPVRGMSADGFHDPHFIDAAAGNIHPAVGSCRHISYRATAGRDICPCKFFCLGIELNDGIRLHSGLAVPDHSVRSNRDAVRS
jgi:hypothetical protein